MNLLAFVVGLVTGLNICGLVLFIARLNAAKKKKVKTLPSHVAPHPDSLHVTLAAEPGVLTLHFTSQTLRFLLDEHQNELDFAITPEIHRHLTPPTPN